MYIGLIIGLGVACQPQAEKQYFTDSPEIDVAKKAITAYVTQDWDLFKQQFADTAHIYHNQWGEPISVDSIIAFHRANNENLSGIKFTGPIDDNPVYEMIVTDDSVKWVHFWGLWNGTFTPTGKELTTPVNISLMVQNGVITLDVSIYDNSPIILESLKIQAEDDDVEDEDDNMDD